MKQKENTTIALTEAAVSGRPFKFGLTQIVTLNISGECGEIKARTQYADGENRYLIYYQDARKAAQLKWFGESMLEAVYRVGSNEPVFAATEQPDNATVSDTRKGV
ncbi:hypothetical protein JRC42_17585 [Escherichia albertii]|uniref:hypothetical protein n=1 Tax=Escherichia albertii TaxID=208962 RepID=UPI00195C2685|nr:hypothetical protein [Escherichia albertii]QST26663.1 hypothetical protein JRC42_13485 [Escherichia albertii]QST27389.1 hypothetical protein JRC42_17585 [Escherichia albertii]QST36756.1 hypothetical protein JRC46_17585 [Escherichia albertii]QST39504.1 hypothetical protein JRC46_09635 [Escherichia albertii]